MNISKDFWDKTEIYTPLRAFPGTVGDLLQQATPQMIVRVQQFLPLILWRWFFLEENNANGEWSPHLYLEYCRKKEKWPQEGIFYPHARINLPHGQKKGSDISVEIGVSVDYITFEEQPLIKDVINVMEGKDIEYQCDLKYTEDIKALSLALKANEVSVETIRNDVHWLIWQYFELTLMEWYEMDDVIAYSFEKNEWLLFWKSILGQMKVKGEIDSDTLLDTFTLHVRKHIPDYGFMSAELEHIQASKAEDRVDDWVQFWVNAAYYFFIPFSWYLPIIAPVFIDKDNFIDDVNELLENYYEEPTPLYAPCSVFLITSFGEKLLKSKAKKLKLEGGK